MLTFETSQVQGANAITEKLVVSCSAPPLDELEVARR